MIDRKTFYDGIRNTPFGGRLTPQNVTGMEAILDEYEHRWDGEPIARIAYVLATAYHETAGMMVPVREGSRANKILTDEEARAFVKKQKYKYSVVINGQVYYGRGLVQITWEENYEKMGRLLNIPLLSDPELALDPVISVKILFEGMFKGISNRGDFTGKSLEDYITNAEYTDATVRMAFVSARRIVNGTDKADQIANIAMSFWRALKAAKLAYNPNKSITTETREEKAVADVNPVPVSRTPEVIGAGALGLLATLAPLLSGVLDKVSGVWGFASLAFVVSVALIAWIIHSRNKIRYSTGE